jgi:uncharacterized protein (TIGR02246 family)
MTDSPEPENLGQRVRQLEDRFEIQQLLLDYGNTLDGRDAAGFADLFAREGEWIAPPSFHPRGREEIRAMIDRMFANVPASARAHYITNMTIGIDGDRASAHARFILVEPIADGSPRIRLSGHYDDVLVREDGRWRFLRRNLTHDLKAAQ